MSFFESIFYMAWRGIAIGLIISAPMGPVGMLCIQRTLDKGRRAGLFTGIGAAISDLFYSLLTGFGLSFIEEFLERNQNIIQLVGSGVLIAFGIYLFRKNPTKGLKKPVDENVSIKKSILGGFLFTFSNPLILFLIVGLFARFNFLLPEFKIGQYLTGFVFIFVGAILWWWLITFFIDKVRSHFNLRSMWLINRIIGVIILLFAVVGIITATSTLVSGANVTCWNERRGYGPFANPSDETSNHLRNETPDSVCFLTPTDHCDALEFRCKVRNHKVSRPWGLLLRDNRGTDLFIDFRATETPGDGISTSAALEVEIRRSEGSVEKAIFADNSNMVSKLKSGISGPDPSGSLNFYKITALNGVLSLFGGLHAPLRLLEIKLPSEFSIDSIGFYLTPGASISPDEIKLSCLRLHSSQGGPVLLDDLEEYFARSADPMEGTWQILDRSLEEDFLRLGGDYRIAMVRNESNGYNLYYLRGAKINSDSWEPGMLKASLSHSGIEGIWDVTWYDAMFQPLSHDIKAQSDASGSLIIQFPYQNSQLRLYPSVTPEAANAR